MFLPTSGGAAVETFGEHEFGDAVGVFKHLFVAEGRADGRHDAFAYAGQNGLFAGTTDELLDVGAHGDTGFGNKLDTVFGNGCHRRSVDDLGVDRCLHGFEHVAACQVDGGGGAEVKVHVGFAGGDEGLHHIGDIAACQIVGFEFVLREFQTRLGGVNHVVDNHAGGDFTEAHEHELDEGGVDSRHQGLEPESHGNVIDKDDE